MVSGDSAEPEPAQKPLVFKACPKTPQESGLEIAVFLLPTIGSPACAHRDVFEATLTEVYTYCIARREPKQ